MKLTSNQKNNLQALTAIALKTHHKNICISDVMESENNITINFTRKMAINELKKLNEYFNTDIRNKNISYSLSIYLDHPEDIVLNIDNINHNQVTLFSNEETLLNQTINQYNTIITNRLRKYLTLLVNTFNDDEIDAWTFYYIAKNNSHIGFAHKDNNVKESFKVFKDAYKFYINDENAEFYRGVKRFIGTENDAKCMCLRRNYNSEHNGSWKICKFKTPINQLWSI